MLIPDISTFSDVSSISRVSAVLYVPNVPRFTHIPVIPCMSAAYLILKVMMLCLILDIVLIHIF
jgi:hypothetical protein